MAGTEGWVSLSCRSPRWPPSPMGARLVGLGVGGPEGPGSVCLTSWGTAELGVGVAWAPRPPPAERSLSQLPGARNVHCGCSLATRLCRPRSPRRPRPTGGHPHSSVGPSPPQARALLTRVCPAAQSLPIGVPSSLGPAEPCVRCWPCQCSLTPRKKAVFRPRPIPWFTRPFK